MQKTISIHQPNYFPWLGYFYKIYQSDIFVFLDDVQFNAEGMQNYHYIKTAQDQLRLKIPVNARFGTTIEDVHIKNELPWKKKHLKTVEMNYKKAPFFEEVFSDYQSLLFQDNDQLSGLDISIIQFICGKLNIETKFVNSSALNVKSQKEDKIIDICKHLNANIYYSGTGAKAYQEESRFANESIELRYSSFKPFEYTQQWDAFDPNVSIFDYLMNCGYDWSQVLQNQPKGEKK